MIEYKRTSISSVSANLRAFKVGRTWKPKMIALDADAHMTSLSLIAPTAFKIIFT